MIGSNKGERMLSDRDAIATIAVREMKTAREFYEGKLGLKKLESAGSGVIRYQSGNSSIFVYESQNAGTNRATAATWVVEDVNAVVEFLKARGVVFEHYEFPGGTRKGDVHIMGTIRNAWFKDPDGNILSIVNA